MRQLLLNSQRAFLARVPRPGIENMDVLVKVHFSMISMGTELASIRPTVAIQATDGVEQVKSYSNLAKLYLGKAIRDPRKAAQKIKAIAQQYAAKKIAELSSSQTQTHPEQEGDIRPNEMADQGWNVGYSAVGEIIAIGDGITDLAVGDVVACAGAGKANHAEFIAVPRNLVCKVPLGCSAQEAASTTMGTIALQGVRRASPQLGEKIAVIGLGLLGQLTVQMLRANGCSVIGLDLNSNRVQRALDLGMDAGSDNPETFKKMVHDKTSSFGADKVIITAAAKSNQVLNLAMEVSKRKGTVVIVGDVGLNVERAQFYKKEIDLLMSTSYGPGRYDSSYEERGVDYPYAYVRWTINRNMQAYLDLIVQRRINVKKLIDKVINLESAPKTYEQLAKETESNLLGVLLEYPESNRSSQEVSSPTAITIQGHRKAQSGKVQYVLVGAGAFGTSMLVPQLEKLKDNFFLKGVVSKDVVRGGNFARSQQLELLTTELEPILSRPDVDLLVIATRHNQHARQVIEGLSSNKHIFVEKPLALTWEDLDEVISVHNALPNPPVLMVGFNRRFSPAMQVLKKELTNHRSPLMISYRLNGGYIAPDHWVQNAAGGGRNLGEACHMYDCFRYLIGHPISSIQAKSIVPNELPYLKNDNFSATLGYEDGSVAQLFYTALGPKNGLPKERVEIYCDGEVYVVDDYKTLYRASDEKILWSGDTDKGHYKELQLLGESIANNKEAPISFAEIIETTAVALRVEDLIFDRVS